MSSNCKFFSPTCGCHAVWKDWSCANNESYFEWWQGTNLISVSSRFNFIDGIINMISTSLHTYNCIIIGMNILDKHVTILYIYLLNKGIIRIRQNIFHYHSRNCCIYMFKPRTVPESVKNWTSWSEPSSS